MSPETSPVIREQILAAAEDVIRERGLRAATTRAISTRAGCAEGSIYRYFPDKHALFIEIVQRRFPEFLGLARSMPERAGRSTVRRNLQEVAAASLRFYREIIPMFSGVMAQRELLLQQRRRFEEAGTGPAVLLGSLATYIRREQRLGRIGPKASPEHVARALLGGCFLQAHLECLLGDGATRWSDEHFAADLTRSLVEGLRPAGSTGGRGGRP